ncbi:MAG: kinase [Candidatus Parcubacteria bacterium]
MTKRMLITSPSHADYQRAAVAADMLQQELERRGVIVDRKYQGVKGYVLGISIGGDGTMMKAVGGNSANGFPTLGINGGDVGFLTSADIDELDYVIDRILLEDYIVEERVALEARWPGHVLSYISNEVALKHPYSLMHTEIRVGDHVLQEALPADGVLIATATGSTAYNISVGGPIISPSSKSVVVNAINPTILNFRSYVMDEVSQGEVVTFRVVSSKHDKPVSLVIDGKMDWPTIPVGGEVRVMRNSEPLLFATFGLGQYLEALKRKKGFAR